jgi:peptide/nickel transport system ATP-binding protein
VGESGSGKSTLGRGILHLDPPTAGTVEFDGEDVAAMHGDALRRRRSAMQMIFQDPMASLNPRQSVQTLLTEPLRAHGRVGRCGHGAAAAGAGGSALECGAALSARVLRRPAATHRHRTCVALEPALVIADEPVSALDVSVQAQVINLLEELQDGCS